MRDTLIATLFGAALGVAVLLGLSGCAPGTDGLRQSCANASTLLADSYNTATAIYRADQKALRATVTADNADVIAAKAAAHDKAFDATLAIFDAKRETVEVVCSYADAIDGGGLKNKVAELVAQVVKLAGEIAQAVADFKKAVG